MSDERESSGLGVIFGSAMLGVVLVVICLAVILLMTLWGARPELLWPAFLPLAWKSVVAWAVGVGAAVLGVVWALWVLVSLFVWVVTCTANIWTLARRDAERRHR